MSIDDPLVHYRLLDSNAPISTETEEHVTDLRSCFVNSDTPLVFAPFYGEFGFFIMSHIRSVHFSTAPEKIVCCRKGEEIFYPSATKFHYDWSDIFPPHGRCGFRDKYIFGEPEYRTKEEIQLKALLQSLYPKARVHEFRYHIPFGLVSQYQFDLAKSDTGFPNCDVVVCARRIFSTSADGDNGRRNYPHWQAVVDFLRARGLVVGQVGARETSFELDGIEACSWDFDSSTAAMIDGIRKARLYLSTDTGPTHLAALLKKAMVVFRNPYDTSYNLLKESVFKVCEANSVAYRQVLNGWDFPDEVGKAVLEVVL